MPAGEINEVVPRPSRGTEFSASWTHQAGERQTWTVRFTGEVQSQHNTGVGGTTLPDAGADTSADEEQVVVGHRWTPTTKSVNEFRLLDRARGRLDRQPARGVKLVVPDAFTSGSAQADQRTTERHIQLTNNYSYLRGRHLLKAGFAIPDSAAAASMTARTSTAPSRSTH